MWRRLLDLLTAARRPLVVVDFETAGLSGAPPVEYAVLIWAPWREPEQDEETRATRPLVPPGLTYASSQRLHPRRAIDPGAMAVHGIRDEDVALCMPYDCEQVRGFFHALAAGDATENEGPAVWCGHNAQGADIAWMRLWGYLPDAEVDAIDTMRIARRLAKEHPFPMSPDLADGLAPCVGHGLDAYASSLTGLHVGLLGTRPDGAHGAMADGAATARCLARMLDLWDLLWPPAQKGVSPTAALAAMLAALDAPEPGATSWDGWLTATPAGYVWRKGKFRDRPAHRDDWVLRLPRLPTGIDGESWWCSQQTADILAGLRPMAAVR